MTAKTSLLFWIKMVVFLDFLGVALVVPLLTSYFRDAGINTKLLGILSSIYSISQIFGGVVMGLLSDTQSKHNILMISLLGSSFSYFIIGSSKNVLMLFFSRILVGLVKQTYTIATTVVNEITDSSPELRSQELGRLSSISTVSFIVGPSLGSLLYSRVSKAAPAQAAACCFLLNAAICVLFIPRTGVMAATSNRNREEIDTDKNKSGASSIYLTFSAPYNLFKRQFADLSCIPNVIPVIMIRLAVLFVEVSMSSRHIVNYYENRFGLPTSSLGYMSTATAVIGMVIQTLLLNPILKFFGGNSSTIVIAMSMMAVCGFLEGIAPSYLFFVVFSQVPGVIASSLLSASLRNVFSNTVPTKHMGKSLGVFSMLISGVGVTAPLYAAQVFSTIPGEKKGYVSCAHLIVLVTIISYFLRTLQLESSLSTKNSDDDICVSPTSVSAVEKIKNKSDLKEKQETKKVK